MSIKIKTKKSYYITEFTVELPVRLDDLNEELKRLQNTGKMVAVYNDGNILGINVEQREKVPEGEKDDKIREILGLATEIL